MPDERASWAAILLLCGCSLPNPNPRPAEDSIAPTGPPALEVRPEAIDFGMVDVGSRATTSLELANVGESDLVLNELRLAEENRTIDLVWASGDVLVAGASADLLLTWSPPDFEEDLESELRIATNDPVAPIVAVGLTGVPAAPQIEVDPTSVDFGEVPLGHSIEQPIAIRNVGYADLEVQSIRYNATGPYELQMEPIEVPLVIPVGEMVEVSIRYAPEDEDPDHGVLTVQSDDPFTPEVHAEQEGNGVAWDTGT